jgi:hypothetical protein
MICARRILAAMALLCTSPVFGPCAFADGPASGEKIYRQRCASCHGASGEGTDENYPHPLIGNRSLAQLIPLIARTMPKESKEKCTPGEAQKVGEYIYGAFYSKDAQTRNKPPRIELARLTQRQYRNAVADLIASFRNPAKTDERHGLRGEYFKSGRFGDHSRVLDRVDSQVKFDFGTDGPAPNKFEPNRFSIRWTGSVLAPETGEYEFILGSEHAVRLWVNDGRRALIDAWVKSGNDTEYRASITLLGGRIYPVRLEFSKSKQGVDDSKKNPKPTARKASIALDWKLPRQTEDAIPQRNLLPTVTPETFVLATPFPPDDRSVGYERGNSISKAWDQATTESAIEVADYIAAHLKELAGVGDNAAERPNRLREFCRQFAERAFRRPLDGPSQKRYIARQFEAAPDLESAVKRVVLIVLKSPRFLYREFEGGADPFNVASRLSFGLWDSIPDEELLKAAAAGKLSSAEEVALQAGRMVTDRRTRSKARDFLFQWLKVDPAPDLAKPREQFPGFDKSMASDLRTSFDLFLDDVVWGGGSDYRQLFLADHLYLNGRLAQFYGASLPAEAPFQRISLPLRPSAGILSHPYLMATFAYSSASSPIHRGVFLARNVFGVSLRPPPEAFAPLPAEAHPELSTRERVALQTRPQQCQSCHSVINPLGFTLENFDAVGRFRASEAGRPINSAGAFETRTGEIVKFAGVRDLAQFVASSQEAQDTFITQLFHYLVKQPIRAFGATELADLRRFFVEHDYNIRALIVEIMVESALSEGEK